MDLKINSDLVIDEYENYYSVVSEGDGTVTLANAFMVNSFKKLINLKSNSFFEEFAKYDGKPIGQNAMDMLRHRIKGLEEKRYPGGIYTISEVFNYYGKENVKFISLYERPSR